jgi:hypothetical protein
MVYSKLATETHPTSQKSNRTRPVAGVVLHHAATTNADWVIGVESTGDKQVSSHLVVKDTRRAALVPEEFRAWSLSDAYWDSWALTVECANESTNGWTISDASHESLAQLVADWARRYKFYPHRNGPAETWTVLGHREVYQIHGGSYATACPGGMDLDRIVKRAQQLLTTTAALETELIIKKAKVSQDMIIFKSKQRGFYSVVPGAVISLPDDRAIRLIRDGWLGDKAPIVLDIADNDLEFFLFAFGGCTHDQIPPVGGAWFGK